MECTVYQSPAYDPTHIARKYIGFQGTKLKLYEVNEKGRTIREALVSPASFDADKVAQAERLKGKAFNQVSIA